MIDLRKFACKNITSFYYKVGKSLINLNAIQALVSTNNDSLFGNNASICVMDFTPGIAVHFSECCHPILGDKIIAQLVPQKGLIVHMSSCEKISDYKCHFIKVRWNQDDEIDTTFIARLRIVITNQSDSFANITNIISASGASIANIKVENRSIDFFDLVVDIKVTTQKHLGEILAALRVCHNARSVRKV